MRRGVALVFFLSALGGLTPSAFGQYPYPSAPPMYGPMPGYGPPMYGPPPMPYYPPAPMPYYPPAPMWMPPPPRPNVIIYGPLADLDAPRVKPAPAKPAPAPAPPAKQVKSSKPAANPDPAKKPKAEITQVQATNGAGADATKSAKPAVTKVQATAPAPSPALPRTVSEAVAIRRTQMTSSDSCGPMGCDDCLACGPYDACGHGPCDPVCGKLPPLCGHGRFLGEVGAYFLMPYTDSRLAYTTIDPSNSGGVDFPRAVTYGGRASAGYLHHTGWGIRGNASYLRGSVSSALTNTDQNLQVLTALPMPFQIVSPSATLQQGIGEDQFTFSQRLELYTGDVECLKECQWMDSTFLFSLGGRYARINQTYAASRNNPGGFNGLTTVNIDRENVSSSSRFEGWGPTGSIDCVYQIAKTHWSLYGNVRGSILWGVQRFSQDYDAQRNSVDNVGVPTFASSSNSSYASDRRVVSIGEAEAGLQYGCRYGRCYVYGRGGVVFQRWWDVGSPTSQDGSLNFLGGTVRVGVTY